ncbi:hypothetical protein BD626DRAFT_434895 [Schizophyllum amplum]|uniref:Uncharacterized protein n=1 Tax=Schizophyllum amplum TaxID=97359 RepID=A0A550C8N4_9AGAR|nr:hypothetical protein BD626DRAFT_434895 [Auriculariopsis ampla]
MSWTSRTPPPPSYVETNLPVVLSIIIPPILLVASYYARKWYLADKLKRTGIGKGAPGFQTNVRQVRITPAIAERLRRGEQVSPEEIEAASRATDNAPPPPRPRPYGDIVEVDLRGQNNATSEEEEEEANEWVPEHITKKKSKGKGKRR